MIPSSRIAPGVSYPFGRVCCAWFAWLLLLPVLVPVAVAEEAGLPSLDLKELLKRTLRDGTRVSVGDPAGGAANQLVLSRTEPVRVKGARPTEIDVAFVVNEPQPTPDPRPANGIVPVLNERVVRLLEQKREEWSERTRVNARREFGNVPVRFEATLFNDLEERHTERLKREGYVEKTLITVPGESAKMKLYVRERYAPRDVRDLRIDVTLAFAPRLNDSPDPDALGVFFGAKANGPPAKSVATGNLAELDPEHLQQFERRVQEDVAFVLEWINKEPLRRVSLQQLEDARAQNAPLTNPLRYPWFGDRRTINVSIAPPPKGALPNRDYTDEWNRGR